MLALLSASALAGPSPAALESWLPTLRKAARRGDAAVLTAVFAEPIESSGMAPEEALPLIRPMLKEAMKGAPRVECRGDVCRASYGGGTSTLHFHEVDGAWRVWDPASGGRIPGQVSLQLDASGPGTVHVELNGQPTFLVDDVHDTTAMVSMVDRALGAGENRLTLSPVGDDEVTVDLRIGWAPDSAGMVDTTVGNVVQWAGTLTGPRTFSFEISEAGPVPGE